MDERGRAEATAVGLGCAALGFIAARPELMAEFEIHLVSETGEMAVYGPGESWEASIECARHICARVSSGFMSVHEILPPRQP